MQQGVGLTSALLTGLVSNIHCKDRRSPSTLELLVFNTCELFSLWKHAGLPQPPQCSPLYNNKLRGTLETVQTGVFQSVSYNHLASLCYCTAILLCS
jgi:hypothetical protein